LTTLADAAAFPHLRANELPTATAPDTAEPKRIMGLVVAYAGKTMGLRLPPGTHENVLRDGLMMDEPLTSVPEHGMLRLLVVDENTDRMGSVTVPASRFGLKLGLQQEHGGTP
jgi:hypothetical protein